MSLEKAIACIKRNKNFLITTHSNLEGDALGSELAFYALLKKMGKQAVIVNADTLPYGYDFLPGIENIKKFDGKFFSEFDCFVVLDCSDLARCQGVSKLAKKDTIILNIDHHISNQQFGDVNWVEPDVSSCAQMVYKLYKRLGIPLNKDIATLLYVGILTDTGSFRYSNTSRLTHKIVAELLGYNLDITRIYNNVYGNIPFQDMNLLIKILSNLKRSALGRVVWCQMRRNILKDKKISVDLGEYVLNLMRAIKDVEVAVIFKENLGKKNEVRVNLRSQAKIDVNRIACFFGGGGHKTASGCTISGSIDVVRKKVLKKIEESLK